MLVGGKCVFIAARVDTRDEKTYGSCNLENNNSVVQLPVAERLLPVLGKLKKYTEYHCIFEYDRINSSKGNFTVFRLFDVPEITGSAEK